MEQLINKYEKQLKPLNNDVEDKLN